MVIKVNFHAQIWANFNFNEKIETDLQTVRLKTRV